MIHGHSSHGSSGAAPGHVSLSPTWGDSGDILVTRIAPVKGVAAAKKKSDAFWPKRRAASEKGAVKNATGSEQRGLARAGRYQHRGVLRRRSSFEGRGISWQDSLHLQLQPEATPLRVWEQVRQLLHRDDRTGAETVRRVRTVSPMSSLLDSSASVHRVHPLAQLPDPSLAAKRGQPPSAQGAARRPSLAAFRHQMADLGERRIHHRLQEGFHASRGPADIAKNVQERLAGLQAEPQETKASSKEHSAFAWSWDAYQQLHTIAQDAPALFLSARNSGFNFVDRTKSVIGEAFAGNAKSAQQGLRSLEAGAETFRFVGRQVYVTAPASQTPQVASRTAKPAPSLSQRARTKLFAVPQSLAKRIDDMMHLRVVDPSGPSPAYAFMAM